MAIYGQNVFDLEGKLASYSGAFVDGVRDIISEGKVHVLLDDGKVCLRFILLPFRLLYFNLSNF